MAKGRGGADVGVGGADDLAPKREANGLTSLEVGVDGEASTEAWRAAATVPGRGGRGGLTCGIGRGGSGSCEMADVEAATVKVGYA